MVCRGSCVARVLGTDTPGVYQIAFEVVGSGKGMPATVAPADAAPFPGWALTLLPDDVGVPVLVACRCPRRVHTLDPARLRAEAWTGRPGHPREVGVSAVEATSTK